MWSSAVSLLVIALVLALVLAFGPLFLHCLKPKWICFSSQSTKKESVDDILLRLWLLSIFLMLELVCRQQWQLSEPHSSASIHIQKQRSSVTALALAAALALALALTVIIQ
jgi:hypothetical protein